MQKEWDTQVQETQRVPNRINTKRNTSRHTLIKLTKIKHKQQILKSARENQQITHKGISIRITADLSIETLQTRREWQDILKSDEREKPTTKITLPSKDLIQLWGVIKSFTDKAKAERNQHHQTSSSTNAKGSSLDRKHKKVYKLKPKTTK